ncbi:hypothetical protein ACFQJ5_07985 [Halomicroarcula sp. GCM10025324]|jgi:predicted RNase H-like nuclease (RuvC/YqgF family)|uniref:DUF7518 family protein n=1 Tax=Haloarcula TaxID=2237 RepID=UPI0023E768BE|nr:hypothetical protein [Halomicroarcula sp. ZS-22-S1]
MCGNRVEELEAHVRELEASVEGLTDELVECKVRLRELENAVDEDLGFGNSDSVSHERADTHNTEATEDADNREGVAAGSDGDAEADAESESTEDSESDIIVA